MSKTNSSVGKLQAFVKSLKNTSNKYVDPFNTFLCQLTFAKASEADGISEMATSLQREIFAFCTPPDPEFSGITNDFHAYVEDLSLPDVIINGEQLSLLHGKYNCATTMPMPTDNTFKLSILNVAPRPFIETIIYPWMQSLAGVATLEVASTGDIPGNNESGSSIDLNYPRANFTVAFPHLKLYGTSTSSFPVYTYYNVKPISIETIKPSNKPAQSLYRSITFSFDYFIIDNVNS